MAKSGVKSMFDIMAEGLTGYIKTKTKMDQNKSKFQSDIMLKQIERKQDFMTKIAELEHVGPFQRELRDRYKAQQSGADGVVSAGGVPVGARPTSPEGFPAYTVPTSADKNRATFNPSARDEVILGDKGYKTRQISVKEAIYNTIAKKPEAQRTEKEKKFMSGYLGTGKGDVTGTQQRKEDIAKKEVLAMAEQGTYTGEKGERIPFRNREEITEYTLENYDIDITDPDIQAAFNKYKPAPPDIDEPNWFKRTFGGQKFPRKLHKGWTYEKRDDGKWHKITE